jgi:hypothetical protein
MMHTVIQLPTFLADCRDAGLSDDEVLGFVAAIASDPLLGDLIPGSAGCRKRRFAGRGNKGKSAGYRTVSYYAGDDIPVLMMALIDKGDRENLSHDERNGLKKKAQGYEHEYRAATAARITKIRGGRK